MPTGTTDSAISGHPKQEDELVPLARLIADALKLTVSELRGEGETRMSQLTTTFQTELAAFRKEEEDRFTRLEEAIKETKPSPTNVDPTTKFWTVYKEVADEFDDEMLDQYAKDLDTFLIFAGLFSAVSTAFIVQIIPSIQPNPSDLTNVLLLRILQQNNSFGGSDPLAPVENAPSSVVKAQSIFFASLSITFFMAFIAVLWKQWILYYKRAPTWGSIVDRGKERQVKFVGLQKWGLHFIMELLPVLLQLSLLLFFIGLIIYLRDINPYAGGVTLLTTCFGLAFYACINVSAAIFSDCPFQTPLSILFPKILPWTKEIIAHFRVWLRQSSTALLVRIERIDGHAHLVTLIGRLCKTFGAETTPDQVIETVYDRRYSMKLSNPAFWRQEPLFTSPLPEGTAASAGFWLLENSTDFSAATAVAAVFSEFQWPSHHHSTTALIRLRDTYTECFRVPGFDRSARRKALQSAAAYYILYHTRLLWDTSKCCKVEIEEFPSDLPPDLLLLHKDSEEWQRYDLFEYLLRIEDRSVPVESARFLSYIAPYWFCGDSDSAIKFRSSRLQTLDELVTMLDASKALVPATLTDCVLCVGAAMDFPLHPEDLIRVDKRCILLLDMLRVVLIGDSDYLALTFKTVVEHIHDIALVRSRQYRYVVDALEILLTLVKHAILPLVDPAWINELLERAVNGGMASKEFTALLKLSAWRKEEGVAVNAGVGDSPIQGFGTDLQSFETPAIPEAPTPDDIPFRKVMRAIQTCGWQEEAVYGGLLAIRDIRFQGPFPFDDDALRMFHEVLDRGNPLRIRQVAYEAMLVTQDQWLNSRELRQRLEDLDFFRQLHSVVVEIARPDYQRSFLVTMNILSEDVHWHSYLRQNMGIWLSLRNEGPELTLRTIANVGELSPPRWDGHSSHSFDEFLQQVVVDEWAAVPGRQVPDLTADRLKPLAEVTERLTELLFDDSYRRAVITTVEQVLPGLEMRREEGYEGPRDDVRDIINDLLAKL